MIESAIHRKIEKTLPYACSFAIFFGFLVLVGWAFKIPTLQSVFPNYITMKANTAVGFMLLASAIWLNSPFQKNKIKIVLAAVCVSAVFTLGVLTLLEYSFQFNFGIDELLFQDLDGITGKFPPGRLAPVTALCFIFLALSVAARNPFRNFFRLSQFLTCIILLLAFQAFVSYLFGIKYTFGSAFYTQMAIHTTVLFVVICWSILASQTREGFMKHLTSNSRSGASARRLIAAAIATPPFVYWIKNLGQKAGLYDADFGTVVNLVGNTGFLFYVIWRNAAADHATEILRKAELEQSLAKEQALQSAKLKAQFLAHMSHEIRTPLNGVIGMTALLGDTNLNPIQLNYLRIIQDSSHGLLNVINDILDFSKVEAGKMELEINNFHLQTLFRSQLEIISPKFSEKNLKHSLAIDPAVPEILKGDPARIAQILLNLLSNSAKFTAHGTVAVSVQLMKLGAKEAVIKVRVTDEGIGMSAAVQEKLFQPFIQADSSTARNFGGTGLGLSISQQLVHTMGGTIGVESVPDKGSTFFFELPLGVAEHEVIHKVKPVEDWRQHLSQLTGKTALIVEDNKVNQMIAVAQLKKLNIKSFTAINGLEAIEMVEKKTYDFVLMDCQMPEMDGYEATKKIRSAEKIRRTRIPIIAMTAHAMKEDREKCLACGMDGYVQKPVNLNKLADEIFRVLSIKMDLVA